MPIKLSVNYNEEVTLHGDANRANYLSIPNSKYGLNDVIYIRSFKVYILLPFNDYSPRTFELNQYMTIQNFINMIVEYCRKFGQIMRYMDIYRVLLERGFDIHIVKSSCINPRHFRNIIL